MGWTISILVYFLLSTSVFASVTIQSVQGASNYTNISNTPKIYGGTAGPICNATDGINTCNNCAQLSSFLDNCNEKAVYPTLRLVISLKSDNTAGYPTIADNTSGTKIIGSNTFVAAGAIGGIEIPWGDICARTTGGTNDCSTSGTAVFKVGISKTLGGNLDSAGGDSTGVTVFVQREVGAAAGTNLAIGAAATTPTLTIPGLPTSPCDGSVLPQHGICNYQIKPGDGKAYLRLVQVASNFPTGGNIEYDKVRLYFSDIAGGFTSMNPSNSSVSEFTFSSDTAGTVNLDNDFVPDLVNGTTYYFVAASVDKAQNIGLFANPGTLNTSYHSAIPNEVFGLLGKNFECFVATATYGSRDAQEVETLRMFRNYLLKNYRKFSLPLIRFYYKHSPRLANAIRDSEALKFISRILLWLPIQFAKVTLDYGLGLAILLALVPLLSLIVFRKKLHGWWKFAKIFSRS